MALTFTTAGIDVSCEKYEITAITDNPSNVLGVQLTVFIEGLGSTALATLEHVKDIGSGTNFTFEINDILRNYFDRNFVTLSTFINQITLENILATLEFREVINNVVQATPYRQFTNLKSFALDAFESDEFITQSGIDTYDLGDAGSTSSKFLTSSPSTILVSDFRRLFLSVLKVSYDGLNVSKQSYVVYSYDDTNTLVNTEIIVCSVPSRTYLNGATGRYDISMLMKTMLSNFDIYKITVQVIDNYGALTPRSEMKTFINSNYKCGRVRGVVLHWINEFGVQESYTFSGDFTRTLKTSKGFIKNSRPVEPTSVQVGELSYATSFNYEYDLYSARVDQATAQWLCKMLINGRVAIEKFDEGNPLRYFPITVLTAEVQDAGEFTPTTLVAIKFRLSNERRGLV
jgi:hypothetical protein